MISETIKSQFEQFVGKENVEDNQASLLAYSYDATPGFQAMPHCIVAPRNAHEVAAVVKLCNEHKIPIVPRGSGTNLSAGTTPLQGGVVLLFKHMDRILEIDEENLTMTVQPGVITSHIIAAAEEKGLFYPPDPGSMHISTIGGNISENAGGLRGLKYGVTRDYVMGLEIVLPNGEIIQTGGKLAKDVAGYDLTRLFVGSEGTLGVVTAATLKLIPKPETKKTMLALFDDLETSAEAVSAIIANRIIPATLEFLDQQTVRVVEDFAQIGLPTDVGAVLLIEQDGPPEVVERDMERIEEICRLTNAVDVRVAKTDAEAEALTSARRTALSALSRVKPTTILEDATVPRSKIAEMVREIEAIAKKYQLTICTFGHAGDGNLHPTCLTDARNEEEMALVEKAFEEIFHKAIELGGTITGEHGVGAMKLPYLHLKIGEAGVEVLRGIKNAIDPNHIMNPGKIFSKSERNRVVI
ncbi:glycolate oxidase subunit GlcD [Sporosarcina sp. Marseille-Q4063]|uniref:glycolate oxidase subunit GlcD n=1 Tax=Sporosarcina sp. Marseille-Q4063 TaxID=2810514 RepID=UPI001BAE97D3|nr:glycolate oxidase subunit GlcD [Sporosarcina sp. Marseille-Q4063]QUW20521.1 glycolate oxidase subunit GlcD [Sporosarcina sp. Marseille-Q4063]